VAAQAEPLNVRDAARSVAPVPVSDSRQGWALLLVSVWAAGVAVSLTLGAKRWAQRRQVLRGSVAAAPDVQRSARAIAAIVRVRRVPEVRISPDSDSPFIMGTLRPVILVPPRFAAMPSEQQRMALCHELAHVKRGDLWLGIVPALAERVFFFHPLARIAAREYAFWREVACDAVVLETLETPPQKYGRLLVDLGVASSRATLAPAGAAWSFSTLKRRIIMLHRPSPPRVFVRAAAAGVVVLATIGLAPFHLVAREAAMVPARPSPMAQTPARIGPQLQPGGLLPLLTRWLDGSRAEPPQSRTSPGDREIRFVYLNGDTTTMSGSSGDVARARRLRTGGEDLLWFLKDGKEYVVRDRDVLKELSAIWRPLSAIGDEQAKIGARQAEIGARQSEVGARQSKIGAEQADIGARQGEIGARQAALAARQARRPTDAERAEIDRQMRSLDDDMRKLDREMRALDDKMRALDSPMSDLGEDMDALGREMDTLGRKMDDAQRKADAGMRVLLERAIASGAAEIVR
jgi:beta-lactamase regulating signal transducer with metallopeptidase domain